MISEFALIGAHVRQAAVHQRLVRNRIDALHARAYAQRFGFDIHPLGAAAAQQPHQAGVCA
jgi:hypothetical protein